jgi:hypothetical protein
MGVVLDDHRVLTVRAAVPARARVSFAAADGVPDTVTRSAWRTTEVGPFAVVLELDQRVPDGVPAAALRRPRARDVVGGPWWAFASTGPGGRGRTAWGTVTPGAASGSWDLERSSWEPVDPAFQGAGLWSPRYRAVVGLITEPLDGGGARAVPYRRLEGLASLAERWSPAEAGEVGRVAWGLSPVGRGWRAEARNEEPDRAEALAEVRGWLVDDRHGGRVLVLSGPAEGGRSAVLGGALATDAGDDRAAVACAVHARGATALEVAQEIARAASAPLPAEPDGLLPALRKALSARPRRFTVVVDGVDEASTPREARTIAAGLLRPLARIRDGQGVRVVAGTRTADEAGDLPDAFGADARILHLDDGSERAAENLRLLANRLWHLLPGNTRALDVLAYAESPGLTVELWQVGMVALGVPIAEEDLRRAVRIVPQLLIESRAGGAEPVYQPRAWRRPPAGGDEERRLVWAWLWHGREMGWRQAPEYLLRSLPGHAARTGLVDELLADDEFLRYADPHRLDLAAAHAVSGPGRRRAALVRRLRQVAPHHKPDA